MPGNSPDINYQIKTFSNTDRLSYLRSQITNVNPGSVAD